MYDYYLYATIAVLTVIVAATFARNVKLGNKITEVRNRFAEYQAQSIRATFALIQAAETEMDVRVGKAALATLKRAHLVEKTTGLTIGQVFGKHIGAEGEALDEREVVAAALAKAIQEKMEGAGLGGPSTFDNLARFGYADGGTIYAPSPRKEWEQEGVRFAKDGGLTSATFDWGPGEPIPTSLPPQVQDLLRSLQAEHDAANPDGGTTLKTDAGNLQAAKVAAEHPQSADPLADPVSRRRNTNRS